MSHLTDIQRVALRGIWAVNRDVKQENGDVGLRGKGASASGTLASVLDGLGPVATGHGGVLPLFILSSPTQPEIRVEAYPVFYTLQWPTAPLRPTKSPGEEAR